MGEKIIVGPVSKGLRNDVRPFVIDNDSFPQLINANQWRGRVKRKRGTTLLNRLRRYFNSTSVSYNSGSTTITLDGSGNGNLLTGFGLQTNGNISPGSVTITAPGPTVYTDPAQDGTLSPSGTINYATGDITIAAESGNAVSATFNYFPDLPVLGLEDFILSNNVFPGTIAFDQTYSYNVSTSINNTTQLYDIYDVSFYKNPSTASYPGYTEKTNVTPTSWNGQDYQQFWTVNYQGALWTTNGINVPFEATNVGMQFITITNIAIVAPGPPASATITTSGNHGLVIGDFVFINEVVGITGINFQTGYVTAVPAGNQITVTFPNATLGGAYASGGIVQYLTNRSDTTKDCLRWYDGDPTDANPDTPTLNGHLGWVNFCPPLSQSSFSVGELPAAQYYLVGARIIIPFKDRLLFLGPVIQTSAASSQIYLQDVIIYSQNGTPYYTASFTDPSSNYPLLPTTPPGYVPILVPNNQTASPASYFEDQTGFGGFVKAGVDAAIISASPNEDALIVGFENNLQTRVIYSGNDIVPFNFFIINAELGTNSTFSIINMDEGVVSVGSRGIIITSQTASKRIDLEIPDQVFQFSLLTNGFERLCAQRDFINEWIYFTYPQQDNINIFPNQTLLYNYRSNTWAINLESYTTYGQFKSQSGFTWATVGSFFPTWEDWNEPWNAGSSTLLQPKVIGGNQQGFVLIRDSGTDEGKSLYIRSIDSAGLFTSPDHGLNEGDFIQIFDCLGTVAQAVNGKIFMVRDVTEDTFKVTPDIVLGFTYLGNGTISRLYIPFIQSKEFPTSWGMGRKTRIGVQQYLLTGTPNSQATLLIYLSQNDSSPYNSGNIVPANNVVNNSLIYSTVLYTCPESTNLGLTPANINLNMVTAEQQDEIWHRINTSLLGDTVQVGLTISNDQMIALADDETTFTITGATQANPCVLTCDNSLDVGQLIRITGVVGMTELNFLESEYNVYLVIAATSTDITIQVDSTGFGAYTSGGTLNVVSYPNPTAEVELHGFIIDVSPSMVLA